MKEHNCYNCDLWRRGYCATPLMYPPDDEALKIENECPDWEEYKTPQKLWENVSLDNFQ